MRDVITTLSDWFSVRSIERYPNCSPAGRTCCVPAHNTLACVYREKAFSKQHRQPRLADRRNCVRRGRLYRGIVKRIILSPATWRKFTTAEMATWVLNFCRRSVAVHFVDNDRWRFFSDSF